MDELVVKIQALIQNLYKVEGNNVAINKGYKLKIYFSCRKRRVLLVCSESFGKSLTMDMLYLF